MQIRMYLSLWAFISIVDGSVPFLESVELPCLSPGENIPFLSLIETVLNVNPREVRELPDLA